MDPAIARNIRQLVHSRSIAALGTLHAGAPYVSMVPYALQDEGAAFVIHVSRLASHTGDMLAEPRVSLLMVAEEQSGTPPQALPRITILGEAKQLLRGTPTDEAARKIYLNQFPEAAPIFELGDFSLFAITPTSARWIGGFGQALTLTTEDFVQALRSGTE